MPTPLDDITLIGGQINSALLEVICDGLSAGMIIYDGEDNLLYTSRRIHTLLQLDHRAIGQNSTLRDFYASYFDCRMGYDADFAQSKHAKNRDAWISDNLAAHWKERCETEDRFPDKHWLKFTRRRMASGTGICIVTDISEHKRSEYQWRADIERVQVIEEILDRLTFPITVTDANHIYVGANKAACSFMDTKTDILYGRSVRDVYVSELASRIELHNSQVLESGMAVNIPERIRTASGEEQLYVTHKIRVGKPGMYYVLTCMEEITAFAKSGGERGALTVSGLEQINFVDSPANRGIRSQQQPPVSDVPKVLLLCTDEEMGVNARFRMTICGMEADYINSAAQLDQLLDYCSTGKLWLDLILVSEEFGSDTLSKIANIGLRAEAITRREIEHSITDIVCTRLNVRCAQCRGGQQQRFKDCTICEANFFEKEQTEILVVEDNPVNQVVFAQILDSLKLSHRIASTAGECLQLMNDIRPDLIFMDTTLPDMDGFALARALRSREKSQNLPSIPIIGVVALAFEGDRSKCIESGMNDMLLKPLSPDRIMAMLSAHVTKEISSSAIRIS